jgi:uncharacterized protein YqgC (DUF456 family)
MGAVEIIVFIIAILLMLLGVAGAFLPVVPGVPLNFVVFLAYGFFDRWESYGFWIMFLMGLLTVVSLVFEQLAGAMGAKKFGAEKAGMIGSVLGAILGLVLFNIPGLILGTFLGAAAAEMCFNKKKLKEASNAGVGALVGCLCGSMFKFVASFFMTALFAYLVLRQGA